MSDKVTKASRVLIKVPITVYIKYCNDFTVTEEQKNMFMLSFLEVVRFLYRVTLSLRHSNDLNDFAVLFPDFVCTSWSINFTQRGAFKNESHILQNFLATKML